MGRIYSGVIRAGLCATLAAAIALWFAAPAWSYLYWANGTTIGRAAPDGTGINASFVSTAATSRVAVDGRYMYWVNGSSIGRAGLDGSSINPSFITGVGAAGLAVNGQYIYWTHGVDSGTGSIGRANLDGSGINTGFITGLGTDPTDLAVDGSFIYWTDFWASAIGRANLNGTGVNQTFIADTHTPLSIAVDAHHIYWYITYDNTIGRANLDGSGKNLAFVTGITADANIAAGLAVDSQHLYWTNPGNGTIGRANIDGSGVNQSFLSGMSLADGLAIDLPPNDVAPPSISGSPVQGATLTAVHGAWTMYPSSYADQWYRCDASGNNCTAAGSASPTYALSAADIGSTIRVSETAGNAYAGSSQPAMSAATPVVTAVSLRPSATSVSCPSGSVLPGGSVTCDVSVSPTGGSGSAVPTGSVVFAISGGAGVSGGGSCRLDESGRCTVSYALATSASGTFTVSASYQGDATYAPGAAMTTFAVAAAAGKSASVTVVSGKVLIREKSRRYVPLKGSTVSVPVGSTVDTRQGKVAISSAGDYRKASDPHHRLQNATLTAAIFTIEQRTAAQARARGGRLDGIPPTVLLLRTPPGQTTKARCRRKGAGGKGLVRAISGSGKGLFRTVGANSVTTIRHATWVVEDRCNGTLTKVEKGTATVTPTKHAGGHQKPVTVHAGQHVIIKGRFL